MRVEKSGNAQLIGWLLLAALVGWLIWLLSPILTPFLFGAILAYICDPLVDRLEAKKLPRTLGVLIVMLFLLGLFILLIFILVPLFQQQATTLLQRLPGYIDWLTEHAEPWLARWGVQVDLDRAAIRQALMEHLPEAQGLAAKALPSLKTGGVALLNFVINLVLVPVVLFYMLRDWDGIVAGVGHHIPRRWFDEVTSVARDIDAVLGQFLRGQLLVMMLMSVYYVTGLWIAGIDFALPIGIVSGMLVFVPYLGSTTGFVFATLAGMLQFQSLGGLIPIWIVFFLGQMLEGFVVTPWLVGDRIGLHPVLVIFALLAFGQLFGFFGVLLALPASAVLVVGIRHLLKKYEASELYSADEDKLIVEIDENDAA